MKKRFLIVVILLIGLTGTVFLLLCTQKGNPNKVLPPGEGLAIQKSDGLSIAIGTGYIAVVKENGELWMCVTDDELLTNGQSDKSVWKLDDNVVSTTQVVFQKRLETGAYVDVLFLAFSMRMGHFGFGMYL